MKIRIEREIWQNQYYGPVQYNLIIIIINYVQLVVTRYNLCFNVRLANWHNVLTLKNRFFFFLQTIFQKKVK